MKEWSRKSQSLRDMASLLRAWHSVGCRNPWAAGFLSYKSYFESKELPRGRATYRTEGFLESCAGSAPEGNWRVTATILNCSGRDVVYSPEAIESLPQPVSATQVQTLAESILDTAGRGERDVGVLERIALVELQIVPRA